jgi:hypothetical protein
MIAMTPATSQPYYPADDQFSSPASMPAGGLAPVSDTKPETVTVTAPANSSDTSKSFFDNLLDVINPLEHFPVISTIYSNLTGDKPNDFTQVAGDTLYGGPLGLLSSVGNLVFRDVTGKTVGDTVWSWVTDKGGDTKMASNAPPRQNVKPSSDMFSFLRANVGSDYDSTQQLASNTKPASSPAPAATASAKTVATAPQPIQTATATQVAAPAPAPTSSTAEASTTPRLLNPLPAWGAPPLHITPSENVRAAGLASTMAKRAHLHGPMSEGNGPAIVPAGSTQDASQPAAQPSAQNAQVASTVPPNIPVGSDGVPQLDNNGEQALLAALNKNGISSAIGQQALMAYQKTMAMNPDPSNASALAATMH